jgi:hypothetical protein
MWQPARITSRIERKNKWENLEEEARETPTTVTRDRWQKEIKK